MHFYHHDGPEMTFYTTHLDFGFGFVFTPLLVAVVLVRWSFIVELTSPSDLCLLLLLLPLFSLASLMSVSTNRPLPAL